MDKVKDGEEGISVHGIRINNLRFADDIDIIEEDESTLERTVHSPHKSNEVWANDEHRQNKDDGIW